MNPIVRRLPWRLQTILGYRPKGEIKGNDFFGNEKYHLIHRHYLNHLTDIRRPDHVESELPPPYAAVSKEKIDEYCSGYFCATIANAGVLDTDYAISIIADGYLLEPLSVDLDRPNMPHRALSIQEYPSAKVLKGTTISLATNGAYNNYFHFLIELGQKIGFLESCGISMNDVDHILINKRTYTFQKNLTAVLQIPESKIVETELNSYYQCEKLIVPSYVQHSYYGHEYVRDKVLGQIAQEPRATRRKRIYVSRRSTGLGRCVANEKELLPLLASRGFETVYFEDYSILEQARLIRDSEVILSPHGAGLSNIIFADPGTKVVELININAVNLTFYPYTLYAGLDYGVSMCDSVDDATQREHMKDITVDISKLAKLLDKMAIS